jgi:hypothetical protein
MNNASAFVLEARRQCRAGTCMRPFKKYWGSALTSVSRLMFLQETKEL